MTDRSNSPAIASGSSYTAPALAPRLFTARDYSDYLFFLALVTLPVDGTVLGFFQPFWTPISPWLFLLYCVCNPRSLQQLLRRYTPFAILPVALVALSIPGWAVFGFHPNAVLMAFSGVIAVPATIAALDIAFVVKRLSWQESVRIIIAVYWFAFAVGVVQWLAVRLHIADIKGFFAHLMYREYLAGTSKWGSGRPQFLFAEPSYIGMHLFGILLPLFWLMRSRDSIFAVRLQQLIVVFAAGSVLMGSGTRIVLDSLFALFLVIILETKWRNAQSRSRGIVQLIITCALCAVSVAMDSRLSSIMGNGMEGDGSFFARIWQSLAPVCGWFRHPWTLITGYGAGNIADAVHQGSTTAIQVLHQLGTNPHEAASWYNAITPNTVWTMCIYTNFITEFGLVGFIAFVVISLRFITTYHQWNKLTLCWLILLVYLYIQFEGYAFAALPLFIWSLTRLNEFRREPQTISV